MKKKDKENIFKGNAKVFQGKYCRKRKLSEHKEE